jgi:hypothetical protein
MKYIDLTGQQFGNWLVLRRDVSERSIREGQPAFLCQCQCGSNIEKVIRSATLKSGGSKGCGCNHPHRLRDYEALYRRMQRDNTTLRQLDFTLTYEEFVEFTKVTNCLYCTAPVTWKECSTNGYGYNLDRKDNDKGYHKDNLAVCCKRCNMGKRDTFTFEEWYGMTAYFRNKGQL